MKTWTTTEHRTASTRCGWRRRRGRHRQHDRDATAYPGAPESCDFTDSDCDGSLATSPETPMATMSRTASTVTDGDGMADAWKTPMASMPTTPPMGAATLTGRAHRIGGILHGSDPTAYDGPGAPSVYAPLDGPEVNALPVTPTVVDGDAPLDQALTHSFTVGLSETLDSPLEFVDEREATPTAPPRRPSPQTWKRTPGLLDRERPGCVHHGAEHADRRLLCEPGQRTARHPRPRVAARWQRDGPAGAGSHCPGRSGPRRCCAGLHPRVGRWLVAGQRRTQQRDGQCHLVARGHTGRRRCDVGAPLRSTNTASRTVVRSRVLQHRVDQPRPQCPSFNPGKRVCRRCRRPRFAFSMARIRRLSTQHRFEIDTDPTFTSANLQTALVDTDPPARPVVREKRVCRRRRRSRSRVVHRWRQQLGGIHSVLGQRTNDPPGIPTLLDPADGVPMGEGMPLVPPTASTPKAVRLSTTSSSWISGMPSSRPATPSSKETTPQSGSRPPLKKATTNGRHGHGMPTALPKEAVPRSFVVGTPTRLKNPSSEA